MATDTTNPKDRLGMLKPDLALLPPAGSIEQARAQQDGARKYGAYNWRLNNVRAMIYISAAKRHLDCFLDGEDYSRDSTYVVLNDDPARKWRMVRQVNVHYPTPDGILDEWVWPTPDALTVARNITIVTESGDGFDELVPRDKYTIVQMPVHHLGHFMACAAIVLDARANGALIDDRPPKGAANDLLAQYTLQKPPPVPSTETVWEGTDATAIEEAERAANPTAADWTSLDARHEPEPDLGHIVSPAPVVRISETVQVPKADIATLGDSTKRFTPAWWDAFERLTGVGQHDLTAR
jgi:hypothetical protein